MRLVGTSVRHALKALTEASLISLIVAALVASTALAAPKNGPAGGKDKVGGSGTIAGPILVNDVDSDGIVDHRDSITFTVSTTSTDRPFVGVRCYQGSAFVYDGYVGYFPTYMYDPWFVMSSPFWDAAASANCTARLFHYDRRGNQNVLSTLSFSVAP